MVGSLPQNTQKFASKYILGAVQSETVVLYGHQVRDLGMKSQRESERDRETAKGCDGSVHLLLAIL